MKKLLLKTTLVLLAAVVAIAIYRFNFRKSIPEDVAIATQVAAILEQNDCYACHSTDAEKPFYGNLPIVKEQVEVDIYQGTRFLNLQGVDLANINEADLAKIEQTMLTGSMPLLKYKMLHWGTGFNRAEKSLIATWVQEVRRTRFATGLAAEAFANEPIQPIVDVIPTQANKVALGFDLFHDGRISADGTISCATCHPLDKGGVDGLRTSKGIYDQLGGINAPTVYNAVFNHVQFWNGRAGTLADQAAGPPENPIEMGTQTWNDIVNRLSEDKKLVELFGTIYPDGLTAANVTDAIAEFEKTLITPNSPFDKYLKGEQTALTAQQIDGYERFKDFNCAVCHVGQAMGGQSFESLGIVEDYHQARAIEQPEIAYNDDDKGRFGFTGKAADLHKYKVPTLRNIALTAPYLHDGSAQTLDEAVVAMIRFQLGQPYSESDVTSIVSFLETLTGQNHYLTTEQN